MTDIISTAPVTIPCPVLSFLRLPKLGFVQGLSGILDEISYALNLAYVQPFRIDRCPMPVVLEDSEKGRDPRW